MNLQLNFVIIVKSSQVALIYFHHLLVMMNLHLNLENVNHAQQIVKVVLFKMMKLLGAINVRMSIY